MLQIDSVTMSASDGVGRPVFLGKPDVCRMLWPKRNVSSAAYKVPIAATAGQKSSISSNLPVPDATSKMHSTATAQKALHVEKERVKRQYT